VPDAKSLRSAWFDRALAGLSGCDLLFFDPDNGFEVASRPLGARNSSKYLFWREVERAWQSGASVLAFQYFAREAREAHVQRLARRLAEIAPGAAVTSLRTAHVAYLMACQPAHDAKAIPAFGLLEARWKGRTAVQAASPLLASRPDEHAGAPLSQDVLTAKPSGGPSVAPAEEGIIVNAAELPAADLVHKRVLCPACHSFVFQMWPEGWDGHAGHKCSGISGLTPSERKQEFRSRFSSLFRGR
jgi:hypothetical protein